ncbi:hypothetical protein V8G54_013868 [Vigna mungo]|uniref:Uncharacterized protein n=1 Tax=Vigna mungo TaxID=3915 RepID=A0AAQ3NJN7_VIGMU
MFPQIPVAITNFSRKAQQRKAMDTCGTQNPSPVHILTLGKLNPYLSILQWLSLQCSTLLRYPVTFACPKPSHALHQWLQQQRHLRVQLGAIIVVGDDEPEDRIVYRFKKEVLKAGVLQECRRRRFFENKHDMIKRKARQASRRNRKRALAENKHDSEKKKDADDDDDTGIDNWELPEGDIPYT